MVGIFKYLEIGERGKKMEKRKMRKIVKCDKVINNTK